MTPQTGQQIVTIHIFPSISRRKVNQAKKFGQLMKYNVINIFLQKYAENMVGRLVLDLFLFFKKALYKLKAINQHFGLNIFW